MTRNEEILANTKAKIEKKQNTITKKQALIEKKQIKLSKTTDETDAFWLDADIRHLEEDIRNLTRDIKELEAKIPTYEAKIEAEQNKYAILDEAPAEAIEFMNYLIESSNNHDLGIRRRYLALQKEWQEAINKVKEESKEAKRELIVKLGLENLSEIELLRMDNREYGLGWLKINDKEEKITRTINESYKTKLDKLRCALVYQDEEVIIRNNVKKAKEIVNNFLTEATKLVGKIISTDLRVRLGDINGVIEGVNGKVAVNTILAGGYNIQCLHTRVLVKVIK